jgi:undecaprenyl-diphosphatase
VSEATAALLGLIQGLTEFLPVSSSGHLALAGRLVEVPEQGMFFEVLLHVATLVAVVFYYRKEVAEMVGALPRLVAAPTTAWRQEGPARRVVLIVLATLPTAIVGITLKDFFEGFKANPSWVGAALWVTAALLLAARRRGAGVGINLTVSGALLIGVAQSLAITPGVSRSGATIAVALLLGLSAARAARFSFLLSIPAISGAMVLQLKDGLPDQLPWTTAGIGFAVSLLSGYFALRLLVVLVERQRFAAFAPYCAVLGTAAILFWP